MDNYLMPVGMQLAEIDMRPIDKTNYRQVVDEIIMNRIVKQSNWDFSAVKIIELYHMATREYKHVPSIDDIEQEIGFYNNAQFEKVADILLEYDDETKDKIDFKTNKSFIDGIVTVYGNNAEMIDDVRSIISDTYLEMIAYSDSEMKLEDIEEILNEHNLCYYLGFSDILYETFPWIVESMAEIIVNDAQQTMFIEFGWDYYKHAYFPDERDAEKYQARHYIYSRDDMQESVKEGLKQLGMSFAS